ncbi:MAG: hypothetical protein M1819_000531 [Sarea resinae]|nr:MAG: hypothetical protein M1819_000531 [Sarea resinae]
MALSVRQYRQLRDRIEDESRTLPSPHSASPSPSPSPGWLESQSDAHAGNVVPSKGNVENDQPIPVEWDGPNDPLNPRNWTLARRSWVFIILWINVFAVDWASSADSQAGKTIAKEFHVSEEAEALSPSLYTFGIAFGALFAGPIAETVGRNPIYVLSRCLHVVWLLGAALAPNFGAQCVFRLFAGLSASILLAIHAASIADIFGPLERTVAWPLIALASFWGTAFAPVAGAWIEQSDIGWRWTEWIALILSGSTLILTLFCLPETFSPILLSWKAAHLRRVTGDNRYKGELEFQDTLQQRFKVALARAFHMLTREPVVVLLGGWLVVEYIVVFGFLQGFTFIFGDTYGFKRGLIGTSFCAIAIGCALWTSSIPFYYHYYKKNVAKIHDERTGGCEKSEMKKANSPGTDLPQPEYRLWSAVLAAPAFPISLFWLGWTNYKSISPWPDLGAVVLLGFSWAGIYVTVYQYILDVYGIYAGSALAIITCWRYLASGAINMISRPMYNGIGVHWTATLLGCLALLLMPAPLVFYHFGPTIRRKSTFANRYSRPGNPRLRVGEATGWR